jgi:hypothetical protein
MIHRHGRGATGGVHASGTPVNAGGVAVLGGATATLAVRGTVGTFGTVIDSAGACVTIRGASKVGAGYAIATGLAVWQPIIEKNEDREIPRTAKVRLVIHDLRSESETPNHSDRRVALYVVSDEVRLFQYRRSKIANELSPKSPSSDRCNILHRFATSF